MAQRRLGLAGPRTATVRSRWPGRGGPLRGPVDAAAPRHWPRRGLPRRHPQSLRPSPTPLKLQACRPTRRPCDDQDTGNSPLKCHPPPALLVRTSVCASAPATLGASNARTSAHDPPPAALFIGKQSVIACLAASTRLGPGRAPGRRCSCAERAPPPLGLVRCAKGALARALGEQRALAAAVTHHDGVNGWPERGGADRRWAQLPAWVQHGGSIGARRVESRGGRRVRRGGHRPPAKFKLVILPDND
jgi:hypothetical protein